MDVHPTKNVSIGIDPYTNPNLRIAKGLFGAHHPNGSAGGVHIDGHAPDAATGLAPELDEGGVVLLRVEEHLKWEKSENGVYHL